ncbi:MAG: hypothetical protein ACYC5K_13475 [Saccharofermentanales bacterium]
MIQKKCTIPIKEILKRRNPLKAGRRGRHMLETLIILTIAFAAALPVPVYSAMPAPVSSQASFVSWLSATGRPVKSRFRGYAANYAVYRDYKLLSYGTPKDVPGNRYDAASKQYAVHGYSYDEFEVTNTYFPNDFSTLSDPRRWSYLALGQDAEVSWMRLTAREKEYIKSARLYYMGEPFGEMNFASLKLSEARCVVIAVPSWYLGFSLYTNHYNSKGQLRYATLHGYGIGGVGIAATVRPEGQSGNVCHIPADRDYVDIAFKISSAVSGYSGLAKAADISRGGIIFRNSQSESAGAGPWNTTRTVRYYRTSPDDSVPFTRQITEKSTVWLVSRMGDLTSKEVSHSFTLIEDAEPAAKGTLKITGAISLFKNSRSLIGISLPLNPKRFLCYEKLTVRLDFTGSALPSRVVFYPPGGRPALSLVARTGPGSGFAEHSYYLSVVPSTLTWDNVRVAPPYQCTARAYYTDKQADYVIGGIEVTGSVYDILYLQSDIG